MKISLRVLLFLAVGLFATEAFAGFGLDLVYQQMDVKAESEDDDEEGAADDSEDDVRSTDFGLHAFFAFGKTQAISLGLFAAQRTFDVESEDQVDWTAGGMVYGPTVRFGLPLKSVMPYLRATYLLGSYDFDMKAETILGDIEMESTYDVSGWAAALGLDVPLGKHFALTIEYGMGQEQLKFKKGKIRFGDMEIEADEDDEEGDTEDPKHSYQGFGIGLGFRF